MSYFEDVLDAEDKLLQVSGHDVTAPHKVDALKVFSFKIKSAPDANTSLAIGQDVSRNGDNFSHKHKAELKRKEGEFDLKWVATNKDYEVNAEWQPKDLNDGMETTLLSNVKLTPKPDSVNWEASAGVNNGGHKMGPIVPYFGLNFTTNHNKEHEVEAHENIVYEKDIHVSSRAVFDVANKSVSEAQGQIAWKNQEWGQVWLRSNIQSKFLGLGWQGKINGYKTAAEVQYDLSKPENTGIGGQPLWMKLGTKMTMANGGVVSCSLASGKDHVATAKYELPIAKDVKLTYTDRCDAVKFFTDPTNAGYTSGFNLEMKI